MTRPQTIQRAPKDKDNPYRLINRHAMEDDRLTFEARGILAYILVKPNDWEIQINDLRRAGGTGRDKVYRILNELIAFGYITREQHMQPDGKMGRMVYFVYENPQVLKDSTPNEPLTTEPLPENPYTAEPDTEKPYTENPHHTNKEESTNQEKSTNQENRATTTTTRVREPESSHRRLAGTEENVKAAPPETTTARPAPLEPHSSSATTLATRISGKQRTRQNDAEYNAICTAVENNGFGLMTPILATTINAFMDTYPTDWILRAMEIAVSSNVIRINYVKGVLANWQREGFSDDNRKYNRERTGNHPAPADDERTRKQREYNERLTRLMADQVNHVIDEAEGERQWAELESAYPGFEYQKLP